MYIIESDLPSFHFAIFNWYKNFGRSFPWRNTKDPFFVLISEKLLQQTVASDRVINAYHTITTEYPTAHDLAIADPKVLEEIFQPLGMFYRAREMMQMANEIVVKFNDEVPGSLKELKSIRGIGEYSARAVLSFAYGKKVPVVDTNIARLLSRLFDLKEVKTQNPARKKIFREIAASLLPNDGVRDFNYALLDLCALVCKTHSPICKTCPINNFCEFYK